ncbi:MAG: retropepsin-like domain-containing protein [Verrucomicrobia bacterium]|nr:retropepsin-like domain-containing protein [Verrucomicrobiota bacterium]
MIFVAALFQSQAASTILAEFPFQFREGLLWVEVSTPQSAKPLNFLLDSGAEVSVINLTTAKQLGLSLAEPVSVRSVQSSMTGFWAEGLAVNANGVALPTDFLALDLSKLSHACEQPVDGLIGADFIKGRIVQIDFEAQKIRLLKADDLLSTTDSPSLELPMEVRRCGMCSTASINGGKPQRFRVDTGCATALQWMTTSVPLKQCTRKVAIGLAKLNIPQAQTTVSLGGQTFRNVPTGLHREAIFEGEAGLLGNGLLSRFKTVTLDTVSNRLILGGLRSSE